MVCHQIRLRGDDSFCNLLEKKKNKKSSVLVCRRGFFGVKLCTVGLHNVMARVCLETDSSEDVLLKKEKAPLLQ